MATDQTVQAGDVHEALRLLQRHGHGRVLQQLEQIEPELAEHVVKELSRFDRTLLELGLDAKQSRRLYGQCEALVLVSMLALRSGLVRLWRDQFAGSGLAQLDPSLNEMDDAGGQTPAAREAGI